MLRYKRDGNSAYRDAQGGWRDGPIAPNILDQADSDVRELLAAVEAALAPAETDFLASFLGVLAASFPASRKSDHELDIETSVYLAMLAPYPADILSAAGRHVLATLKFFPSVAELLDVATDLLDRRIMLRNRAAAALGLPPIPRARKSLCSGIPTDMAPEGFSFEQPGFYLR